MKKSKNGFTLIEMLVSVTLISFSIMFLMKSSIVSLNLTKNSQTRFRLFQELRNKKEELQSYHYNSAKLTAGNSLVTTTGGIHFDIIITDLKPTLKQICINGELDKFHAKILFFKSKIIREVNNE